ncbi:MAG: type II toxin-antitoxin system VapC family toxin [Deltaproteobacteria bacterium]|nr:type II toxin-antitoxin system VapC family toxin [Deltaproteobacteria bacterium]
MAERGSEDVRRWCTLGPVAVSRLAYPEARSAFARRCREQELSPHDLRRVVDALHADLGALAIVEIDGPLARIAGELAEAHALRGIDALHLASAARLQDHLGSAVRFGCFDRRLERAAIAIGLGTP